MHGLLISLGACVWSHNYRAGHRHVRRCARRRRSSGSARVGRGVDGRHVCL